MKKTLLTILVVVLLLVGCENKVEEKEQLDTTTNTNTSTTDSYNPVQLSIDNIEIKLSERDQDSSYDESTATKITFNNSTVQIDGNGADSNNNAVTINQEGTYIISGSGNGQIIVEASDTSKVQLVLNNLSLTNTSGAAVIVGNCDKTFITVPANTTSTLSDGNNYTQTYDDSTVDAVIFAKSDITINGSGNLNVNGNYKHGIVGKDDVRIYETNISVNSTATAIEGKDSLEVFKSTLNISAQTDGLKASNDTDSTKGFLYINNSDVTINASDKAIQAETYIIVDGGNFNLKAGDDCFNSNNIIQIEDGNFTINSNDDGIHADYMLTINGGSFKINAAEGLEATLITINDGTIEINATDDGINAAQKVAGYTPTITINGGDISINMAQGDTDALDSNGNIIINGGVVNISAQFAFDFDGKAELNGGKVIVNGQEVTSITNSMMMGNNFGGPGNQGGNFENRPGGPGRR